MTDLSTTRIDQFRAAFLRLEGAIGRDVCADPVLDIILMIASENARERYPTINEVLLAVGAPRETARRFIEALLSRKTLAQFEGSSGLCLSEKTKDGVATIFGDSAENQASV